MPPLAVWYVRTALINLWIGLTLGMLLLFNKGVPIRSSLWRLLPLHIEFMLLGWTLQFIFGIAFWVLPRFRARRGNERLAQLAYVLLNVGVWIVVLGYWLDGGQVLLAPGRALEAGAVVVFALHAWPRIKPPGRL